MPKRREEAWRCQFCDQFSPMLSWLKQGTLCPKCGREYDPILAQEGDD